MWSSGCPASVLYRPTYAELKAFIAKGRKPDERAMANETAVKKRPNDVLAIQHYNTDILRYYKDGRISVCTSSLCTSDVTRARIYRLTGFEIRREKLPTVNGRRPAVTYLFFLHVKGNAPVAFNSVGRYIVVNADGKVDMSAVRPYVVAVVKDPKRFRALVSAGQKIYQQCRIRYRLGANMSTAGVSPLESADYSLLPWILNRITTPLDEIDYETMPRLPQTYENNKTLPTLNKHIQHSFLQYTFMEQKQYLTL